METVDDIPLNQQAKVNLARLIRRAGQANAAAPPGDRASDERVAVAVLDAFRRSHQVRDGRWVPKRTFRLAGGALVTRAQ